MFPHCKLDSLRKKQDLVLTSQRRVKFNKMKMVKMVKRLNRSHLKKWGYQV